MWIHIFFWFCLFLVFYAYVGYGLLLFLLVSLKRSTTTIHIEKQQYLEENDWPEVTLLIAAYNEEDFIEKKIKNSLALSYPLGKLNIFFVTDGSTDRTPELARAYAEVRVFHEPERRGKIAAVNRVMPYVETDFVIFTDANTFLNQDAVKNMVRHFANPEVGAVAGEKRVWMEHSEKASAAGEGIYWKYESKLKQWDWELWSVVGAAGELFAVRKALYEEVPAGTVIEDFVLTLRIAQKGYRVAYEPQAYALEKASASVTEELKRKIRIAAGGLQAIVMLKALLNPLKYKTLSFQYISHRVLRWTLAPLALPMILLLNVLLWLQDYSWVYTLSLWGQIAFYLMAFMGAILERQRIKLKAFFVPYYFCIMNYAVYRGAIRFFTGRQTVLWERAKRGV